MMVAISIVSLFLAWVFLEVRYTTVASHIKRRAQAFVLKTDGSQTFEASQSSSRSRGMKGFKRTASTKSTLRVVNSNKGEHAVVDTSSRRNGAGGPTRRAALTRRKSSQIIYERKLVFYRQLTQMVRVVRRMSEPSVTTSHGLQITPSISSITEEQELEDAEAELEQAIRNRRDGVTRLNQEYGEEDGDFVDEVFEPPRKCRQPTPAAKADVTDGKEVNEEGHTVGPETNPSSTRVRKISIVDVPDICQLEDSWAESTAPEVDAVALAQYRSLIDTLNQSSERGSDRSEPDSVHDFLTSRDAGTETRL